ncbi:MAG TPA: NAD-dependent epimerase/dehydratase family protein [Planctomycetota bacterium]|nr:NAD-dependent epimerase/dehydratase family protein [Planctomycetota bacterium]
MIKKVFITGGCGFIGSYLARQLVQHGFELLLFDAFINYIDPFTSNYQHFLNARMEGLRVKVRIERGDIRVQKRMQQLLNEWKPDAVVHLAALPSAKESTLYPTEALQINVDGTLSVLEGVKACGTVSRFVFASSSFVYGHFKTPVADEEHPTDPIDVYGGTKLTGEILTKAYARQHGFEHVIIRPSAVYGFGDCNRRVTQILIENAMNGKPLVLHDGGRSMIDFTYVTDVSDGFVRALTAAGAANQTFNITRGNARSVREFALEVQKHFPESKLEERPTDAARPERGTLSIQKARKLLGYEPKIDIEQGIAEYVAAMKSRGPR